MSVEYHDEDTYGGYDCKTSPTIQIENGACLDSVLGYVISECNTLHNTRKPSVLRNTRKTN